MNRRQRVTVPLARRGARGVRAVRARLGHSGGSAPDVREMTEVDHCAGALGARVGRQADELGALFPQAPCEVVVLGLVAGGDHLFVFDVLPGERGGGAG